MGYSNHVLLCPIIVLILTPLITGDVSSSSSSLVIGPHCSSKCGDVTIPYPFGIEPGCYHVDRYSSRAAMRVTCDDSTNPPKLILGRNIETLVISVHEAEIRLNTYISYDCHNQDTHNRTRSFLDLVEFTISKTKNMLVATGCDTYAWFTGLRYGEPYFTGCMTICNELNDVVDGECNGVGCCEASIPDGVTNLTTKAGSFSNHTDLPANPCSAAYPVATDAFKFSQHNLTQNVGFYVDHPFIPVIFNWGIGTQNCSEAKKDKSCLCKDNTICSDLAPDQDGYRCNCNEGFTGNPYLPQGCKDIDECKEANDCEKPDYCINTNGSYYCKCPKGYDGKATKTHVCVSTTKAWLTPVIITAGIGGGIILLLIAGFLLYRRRGETELRKLRKSNFRENGGLILHQKISRMDTLKIFTARDLANATDKYNEANIIGRGGFGVVFKGILPDTNHQVAIKRSLKVDPNQVEQFINEVLVLSQINNRNVVRLLGCCLETEVPLLVYEFINNGTLYDHLHDEGKASRFTWSMRLRIASEIADVLSYLHTTITTPIIHRDMKSMNILLDESYTAKVADFGASKLVPLDQDQLATVVLGTKGYLDPEYMLTHELTEKSDVYSFGVVLVELLTKEKALCYQKPKVEQCLAMYFLLKMKEDCLLDIVDKNILNDNQGETIAQVKEVGNLARWCLRIKGEERPTMKEVAMELERIKRMANHTKHYVGKSYDQLENSGEHHLVEISMNADDNTADGKESDLYSIPAFNLPPGDGR